MFNVSIVAWLLPIVWMVLCGTFWVALCCRNELALLIGSKGEQTPLLLLRNSLVFKAVFGSLPSSCSQTLPSGWVNGVGGGGALMDAVGCVLRGQIAPKRPRPSAPPQWTGARGWVEVVFLLFFLGLEPSTITAWAVQTRQLLYWTVWILVNCEEEAQPLQPQLSLHGQFISCFGALDHIAGSSLADGSMRRFYGVKCISRIELFLYDGKLQNTSGPTALCPSPLPSSH